MGTRVPKRGPIWEQCSGSKFTKHSQVSKRAGHAVGMTSVNHLAPHVHSNLAESAALTCKGVDAFGAAVEAALIKHGELANL